MSTEKPFYMKILTQSGTCILSERDWGVTHQVSTMRIFLTGQQTYFKQSLKKKETKWSNDTHAIIRVCKQTRKYIEGKNGKV